MGSLKRLDLADSDDIFYVTYATNDEEVAANEADLEELEATPCGRPGGCGSEEQVSHRAVALERAHDYLANK